MRTNWLVAHDILAGTQIWTRDAWGRGIPAALPARGGGCTRGWEGFIHSYREAGSLIVGAADKAKAGGLECCQDQCTPLHDTNGNQKRGEEREGRGRVWWGIGIRKVSPHQEAICRSIVSRSISHSLADIAKAIRMASFISRQWELSLLLYTRPLYLRDKIFFPIYAPFFPPLWLYIISWSIIYILQSKLHTREICIFKNYRYSREKKGNPLEFK